MYLKGYIGNAYWKTCDGLQLKVLLLYNVAGFLFIYLGTLFIGNYTLYDLT